MEGTMISHDVTNSNIMGRSMVTMMNIEKVMDQTIHEDHDDDEWLEESLNFIHQAPH